ncbi:actin patch protein 1, partial [Aureobasidium melanogenum]
LLPSTRRTARNTIRNLRFDTLPRLRHSAQSRIYRFLVGRQLKKQQQRKAKGILAYLRQRSPALVSSRAEKHGRGYSQRAIMSYRAYQDDAPRESGGRRKKLAGYLKAANELRQSYASQWSQSRDFAQDSEEQPGIFPGADVVRSGDEEMIIFPSYATKHIRAKPRAQPGTIQQAGGTGRDYRDTVGAGDAEFWKSQWEEYEQDKAIVDVDVRGWLYTPHKGQLSRKHRLMVGLARQLVGIQAPSGRSSSANSRASSRSSSPVGAHRDSTTKQEEEVIQKQADEILKKGEKEAEIAGRGGFSERPSQYAETTRSREPSPAPSAREGPTFDDFLAPSRTNTSGSDYIDPVQKRSSWPNPAKMSSEQLVTANNHLMARLRPFMANPLANASVSAFFYNDKISRQRTVQTNAAGHFHLRAALDFVPTHVRILASEDLSATEEVKVVPVRGVSLISDIDDTIKHSAITSGAREIFRNAFIRDLGDLTIEGVRQWYGKLADMGVQMHYVSNSPWQLYPVITGFFKAAGLPPGSFHLKQYSGMLQGIFEPVAERKKATLDRLFRDFPERKFVLVGDSGEADLEVYTDTVLEYPGRVVAIFIRDVTSKPDKGFFDPSMGPLSSDKSSKGHLRNMSTDSLTGAKRLNRPSDIQDDDEELRRAIAESLKDIEPDRKSLFGADVEPTKRPALPPRRPTDPPAPQASAVEENLIDFSDDESTSPLSNEPQKRAYSTSLTRRPAIRSHTEGPAKRATPPPPPKPLALRSPSGEGKNAVFPPPAKSSTPPPPKPRKPSTTVNTTNVPSPLSQVVEPSPATPAPPPLPKRHYLASAKQKLSPTTAYFSSTKRSPTWASESSGASTPGDSRTLTSSAATRSMDNLRGPPSTVASSAAPSQQQRPKPPPPRRNLSHYPAAAASYATNRLSGAWNDSSFHDPLDPEGGPILSKKEELWKRRWAKAKSIMEREGVVLRTWRVGNDVMDVCVETVRQELVEMEKKDRRDLELQKLKDREKEGGRGNGGGRQGTLI